MDRKSDNFFDSDAQYLGTHTIQDIELKTQFMVIDN